MVQCKSWEQSRRSWSARCMSSAGLQHRSWAAQSCKSRFRRRPRKSARQPHISGPDCDKLRSPPLLQAQFAASLLGIPAATGLTSKMSSKKNADFLVINMLFFMVPKIVTLVFPFFFMLSFSGFHLPAQHTIVVGVQSCKCILHRRKVHWETTNKVVLCPAKWL